jgi:hypothetical protein
VDNNWTIEQRDFLSATTTFRGSNAEPLVFHFEEKAAVNYAFNQTAVGFNASSGRIAFARIDLAGSRVSCASPDQISLTAEHVHSDIESIPEANFASFIVSRSCTIEDNDVKSILLTNSSVQVTGGAGTTPVMQQVDRATFNVSATSANISIGFNRTEPDSLLPNFFLIVNGGSTVHLEASFYHVRNPSAMTVVVRTESAEEITIESELVNVPEITVIAENGGTVNVKRIAKKPVFTAELAFWVFLGLLGVIAIISLILCVVGNYCLPPEEEFDVSSESVSDANAKARRESLTE